MKSSPRVLVVDDQADIVTMLQRALSRHGFNIDCTTSPDDALARADSVAYDAALVDLVMPGRDGVSVAAGLRERIPGLPVAVMTAYPHSPLLPEVLRVGVTVFHKPVAVQDLVDFLQSNIP
ncbi:MAG TPA: response regulator [Vicinamibacteria bacterium]|nr:response regulator [Vicinamibacteria bacterium]